MAGHSKWANIKHRKGAQDKKRGNMFTKLAREIIVAAKMGQPDPAFNPRLRLAISAAKAQSMPKDRIDTAIKKGSGELSEGENFEEVRYEGFGANGVALMIECLTDNRNRTASEVRTALNKNGGNLGETGSVGFMFRQVGFLQYPLTTEDGKEISADAMFEAALEAGADNAETDEEMHTITCAPDDFSAVRDVLAEKFGDAQVGRLAFLPETEAELDDDGLEKLSNLIDKLEDLDDVQHVYANVS